MGHGFARMARGYSYFTEGKVLAVGLAFSHIQIQFWALKCLRKIAPKRY